ncbi:MAG: FtsK/SpoIIIE domain-containing protein, partial [Actinomycetota bacterium]|nr:FtsK/SpoIIIE domain-containing protein [Actinomycetota bacterium]
ARQAVEQLAAERRIAWPDPAAVVRFATGPHRRLWERRPDDLDALDLRIGLAELPVGVELVGENEDESGLPKAPAIPVVVSLRSVGVLGIAGPRARGVALARWLVIQLAVLHSPRNLALVLLTDEADAEDWSWFRWLPHANTEDGPVALIGNTKATREARVKELAKIVDDRQVERKEHGDRAKWETEIIVVADGARSLRGVPGLRHVLRDGPAVGIRSICLDLESAFLPEEGRAEVVFTDELHVEAAVEGEDPVIAVVADAISVEVAETVGRAMAPVRDVTGEGGDLLPRAVRFAEIVGVDIADPASIVARWTLRGHSTRTCIGVDANGAFDLDIDFKADGPHSLVVGSTGAGKSEFLRTFIAGLAVNNRPDALNIVLIDFKGGGAFSAFEALPHTVGFVTNLDATETQRALVSLDAELERRQRELLALGADNLEAAWASDPGAAAGRHLARLVIVIDELAELVDELPDFVPGLIRIARVGRSLGVHLVLATQRPSAKTVTPEMRTNTALRIALRLNDKSDSADVIDAPNAATILKSQIGRGYVRTELKGLVQFQTALSSGLPAGQRATIPLPTVTPVPWAQVGLPLHARPSESAATRATDLDTLVGTLAAASAALGVEASPSPWLPPLPKSLVLDLSPQSDRSSGAVLAPVAIGREDVPSGQVQRHSLWDLERDGHIAIVGTPRSGRTTALRSMIGALTAHVSPSDVHVYGFDFGNGGLLPAREMPHSGAIVLRTESDRIERLIGRLAEELRRRQDLLTGMGVADVAEQRRRVSPEERLPYIVVVLDRWEAFNADFAAEALQPARDELLRLIRESLGAGMRFVIAGDQSLLTHRVAQQLEKKLVLRLSDRQDYRLVGIDPRTIPADLPPGRGYWAGQGVECQLGLLTTDPSGGAQGDVVRELACIAAARWPMETRTSVPLRVDVMPAVVAFDDVWGPDLPSSPLWVLVGIGGDDVKPVGLDLALEGPGFVIGGPPRSGRSSTLLALVASARRQGTAVIFIAPRPSPLTDLAGADGVSGVVAGAVLDHDKITAMIEAAGTPLLIAVDDADAIVDQEVIAILENVLARATPVALAIAGKLDDLYNQTRGFVPKARRSKVGVLLSPSSIMQGDLTGVRLQRSQLGKLPPGRGFFCANGETVLVQIPLAGAPLRTG